MGKAARGAAAERKRDGWPPDGRLRRLGRGFGVTVAATRARREKIARLAAVLASAPPNEVALAASYLCGIVPQDKLGVGWAGLQAAAAATPAPASGCP